MSDENIVKADEPELEAPKPFKRKRKGARTIYEVVVSAIVEGFVGAFAGAVIAALLFAMVRSLGPSMVHTLGPNASRPIQWLMHKRAMGPIGWASNLAVWGGIIGAIVGVMNAWSDRGRFFKNR